MRQLVPRVLGAVLLGTLALASIGSHAQTTDTLDWKRYYPLDIGNVWEYHDAEARDVQIRYALVADTVANGQTYVRRQIDQAVIGYFDMVLSTMRSTGFDYVRYDEGGVIAVASVEADTVAFDPCSDDGFERDLRPAFGTVSPCPPALIDSRAVLMQAGAPHTRDVGRGSGVSSADGR